VCLQDVAVWSRLRDLATRRYEATAYVEGRDAVKLAVERDDDARVCVRVPSDGPSAPAEPRYVVVDVVAETRERERTGPARLHFWDRGGDSPMLVGLERPASGEEPRW